jgi:hypothetical protein
MVARSDVPFPGADSVSSAPATSRSRSRMATRPKRSVGSRGSKPRPLSSISTTSSPFRLRTTTLTESALACLVTVANRSCRVVAQPCLSFCHQLGQNGRADGAQAEGLRSSGLSSKGSRAACLDCGSVQPLLASGSDCSARTRSAKTRQRRSFSCTSIADSACRSAARSSISDAEYR